MNPIDEREARLREKIFQAIGQASMCWEPRPSYEVFAMEEAEKIANELLQDVLTELKAAWMREKLWHIEVSRIRRATDDMPNFRGINLMARAALKLSEEINEFPR